MKAAIMQPYFLPYIGYWQLIHAVDSFVILDDVQYIKRGWINRNRILCDGREHYIIKPVADASQNRKICETMFADDTEYRDDILRTVKYAYRKAPYLDETIGFLSACLLSDERSVSDYLEWQIRAVCDHIGITTEISRASDYRGLIHKKGQDGIIELCTYLGCDEYINPIGGMSLYDRSFFSDAGIVLRFLQTDFETIGQTINIDNTDYSIVHLLMNCSKEEMQWMLDIYELI